MWPSQNIWTLIYCEIKFVKQFMSWKSFLYGQDFIQQDIFGWDFMKEILLTKFDKNYWTRFLSQIFMPRLFGLDFFNRIFGQDLLEQIFLTTFFWPHFFDDTFWPHFLEDTFWTKILILNYCAWLQHKPCLCSRLLASNAALPPSSFLKIQNFVFVFLPNLLAEP